MNNLFKKQQIKKGTKKSIVFENIGTDSSHPGKDSNKDLLESLAKELQDNQKALNKNENKEFATLGNFQFNKILSNNEQSEKTDPGFEEDNFDLP